MSNDCCLRGMKNLQVQLLYGRTDGQWRHDGSSRRLPSASGDEILRFPMLHQHPVQIVQFRCLSGTERGGNDGRVNPSRPWNRRFKSVEPQAGEPGKGLGAADGPRTQRRRASGSRCADVVVHPNPPKSSDPSPPLMTVTKPV